MFGAPKKCAKCDKQVYPIEELKCLDKIWHKNCFKCSVCNSVLNMKNYKGFEKQPYCFVHYPQQKPTVVSENPELLRIKENTKIQSNAKYHEDFEKSKGVYTVVADDPETRRVLENTKIISQVKYHEDFEKNKKKYTPVLDNLETIRAIENQKIVSSAEYKGIKNQNHNNNNNHTITYTSNSTRPPLTPTYKSGVDNHKSAEVQVQTNKQIGSIADYDPLMNENQRISNGMNKKSNFSTSNLYQPQPKIQTFNSISNINYQNGYSNHNSNGLSKGGSNGISNQINGNNLTTINQHSNNEYYEPSINEYDIQSFKTNGGEIKTTVYRAIYDYDGKEDDELSFRDGDKFINCEQIDVGWMIGVHEKTGKHGMFPANYAEPVDYF